MASVVVAGLGWGDEGKGSIVDFLTRHHKANWIVRYNGGPQAAHNVVTTEGQHHSFHQFGSGTLAGAGTFLSEFMLIHPESLIEEYDTLRERFNIRKWPVIDENCVVITPYHIIANQVREILRGDHKHGTCGWGVGEARGDVLNGSVYLRMKDLTNPKETTAKLQAIWDLKTKQIGKLSDFNEDNPELRAAYARMFRHKPKYLAEMYQIFAKNIHIVDRSYVSYMMKQGTVIFEGAQGVLLDEKHGVTPPHVTWTDCTMNNALDLCGTKSYMERIGVIRSYMTRHGAGPFPSQAYKEDIGLADTSFIEDNTTGKWQGEFRLGYLDTEMVKYGIRTLGHVDKIALTHVDRMRPLNYKIMAPLLERVQGDPVQRIEEALGVPLGYLSSGPTWQHKYVRTGKSEVMAR